MEIPELEIIECPRIVGVLEDTVLTFHLRFRPFHGEWMSGNACLDLQEFADCLESEGVYEILTCSCGVPECAGRWRGTAVWHRGDDIVWYDLDRKSWVRFRRAQLVAEIDKLKSRLPFHALLGGEGPRLARGALWIEPYTSYRFFRRPARGDRDQEIEVRSLSD